MTNFNELDLVEMTDEEIEANNKAMQAEIDGIFSDVNCFFDYSEDEQDELRADIESNLIEALYDAINVEIDDDKALEEYFEDKYNVDTDEIWYAIDLEGRIQSWIDENMSR